MSIFSALNADDLMVAARDKLQPLLDQAYSEVAADEKKALAALAVEVAAALSTMNTIAAQLDARLDAFLAKLPDLSNGVVITPVIRQPTKTP